MSTVIKGGTIVTADLTYKGDVKIEGGKIVEIGQNLTGNEVLDASGCYVMPGGIDPHTHLEMPFMGTYSSDDFESGTRAALVCLLLLFAAAGKAAQVPFSGWLPRAMEGPTPSSAIFYGAISIHAGAYLLLRAQPLLAHSGLASALVILIGVLTAIHGTIVGRATADAKTSLAYASLTQVGVIFVEIGIGWAWIAVLHTLGHATVRTLQFLRSPSMLHDYHQMHSAAGGELVQTGKHLRAFFPERFQLWLYRWALDRGQLDTILDRLAVDPLLRLSRIFAKLDGIAFGEITKRHEEPAISLRAGGAVQGD